MLCSKHVLLAKNWVWGICSLIFNLSDQSYDYKDYFLKSRPYTLKLWSFKEKTFEKYKKFW